MIQLQASKVGKVQKTPKGPEESQQRQRRVKCKHADCDGALGVENSVARHWGVLRFRKCTECRQIYKTTEVIDLPKGK